MQPAADVVAPPTVTIGAALIAMDNPRAGKKTAALTQNTFQGMKRTVAAPLSPSPPMSTCRRLSYESAKTGSTSRSRMRASPSPVVSSPSHHRRSPSSSQQEPHQQHFWQRRVPTTERNNNLTFGPPCIRVNSAVSLCSPDAAGATDMAEATTQVNTELNHDSLAAVSDMQPPCESGRAPATTTKAVATVPRAAASRPLPAFRSSAWATTSANDAAPVTQPQSQHAAPPRGRRSDRSRSSGARGAGIKPVSLLFHPAPTLRSTTAGGPSPFSAEQLAMPRRTQPQLPGSPTGNGTAGAGTASSRKMSVTTTTTAHQRAPPVHLVRPAGLYRSAATAGSGVCVSTAMAASLLPGAAAAQDRLQPARRSRLTRTPSAGHFTSGDGAREAESVLSSSLLKRRTSVTSVGSVTEDPVRGATMHLSSRRRRSSTPSIGHSAVLRSSQNAPAVAPASSSTAIPGGVAPHPHLTRSNSAPVCQPRGASSRTSIAAARTITSQSLHTSVGPALSVVGPSPVVRSASLTSVRQQRPRAAPFTAVSLAGDSAPVAPESVVKPARSASMMSATRRSRSRDSTAATARSRSAAKTRGTSLHAATTASFGKISAVSMTSSARCANAGISRPHINSTCGTGGARMRPVVSTATGAAAGSRRPALRQSRDSSRHDIISVNSSSMVSMEESRSFLREVQQLDQRELALFGTLLAKVASEKQKHSHQSIPSDAAAQSVNQASAPRPASKNESAGDVGLTPPNGALVSAGDVSVWTCKRAAPRASNQERKEGDWTSDLTLPSTTLEKPGVGAPPVMDTDEELIVLIRRSRSHSAAPDDLKSLSAPTLEAGLQHQRRPPGGMLPSPSVARSQGGERNDGSTVVNQHTFPRPSPPSPHIPLTKADAGLGSDGTVAVFPDSRSPSPTPQPPSNVAMGNANELQVGASLSTRTTLNKDNDYVDPNDGIRGGGLRLRNALDINTSSDSTAAQAAPKGFRGPVIAASISAKHKAALICSREAVRYGRPSDGAGVGRRRRSASGGRDTSGAPPTPQRELSTISYTDIPIRRSPLWQEVLDDGGHLNGVEVQECLVETHPFKDVSAPLSSPSSAKSEATAPLAALRKVKELAAEQAAAARAKAIAADKCGCRTAMTGSSVSPSVISSAVSPMSGSLSMSRVSGNGTHREATEVSAVRVTASQLKLLIVSSRSEANHARYLPL